MAPSSWQSKLGDAKWRWLPALCLLALAIAYGVLAFCIMSPPSFFISDEGAKAIQVQNFVQQKWTTTAILYPGQALDQTLEFFPIPAPFSFVRGESIYLIYPLAFTLLASVPYGLVGYPGLYLIPIGAGLFSLYLTYRLARRQHCTTGESVTAMLLLAIATPFSFYCLTFWEHTVATALFLLAVLLLIPPGDNHRWRNYFLAGLCLGALVNFRTEGYVFLLAILAAWLLVYRRWTATGPIISGALIALVPLWISNQLLYGSPMGPHLAATMAGASNEYPPLVLRLLIAQDIVIQGNLNKYVDAALGLALLATGVALATGRLRRNLVMVGASLITVLVLGLMNANDAAQVVIRGLLPACPLTVMALVYVWVRKSERSLERTNEDFLVLTFIFSLALVILATPMDTGLHWGSRYVLPTLPIILILTIRLLGVRPATSWSWSQRDQLTIRVAGAALVLLGTVIQIQGIRLLAREKAESAQLVAYFRDQPVQYVISEVNWFAAEAASLFYQRTFFYVSDQTGYEELVSRLYAHGVDGFALLPLATSNIRPQIRTSYYVVQEIQQFQFHIVPADR